MKDRPTWQLCEILSILLQSLAGLASLHASPDPVIHRDIKPENILVMADGRFPSPWIKLADFGLAIEGTRCGGQAGTWLYTAPEVFSIGEEYTSKIDVWSLGMVLMQLLLQGCIPTPKDGNVQGPEWCNHVASTANDNLFLYRWHDTHILEYPEGIWTLETELWEFVTRMLIEDPHLRPSADDCLGFAIDLFWSARQRLSIPAEGGPSKDPEQHPDEISSSPTAHEKGEQLYAEICQEILADPNYSFNSFVGPGALEHMTSVKSSFPRLGPSTGRNDTTPAAFDPGVEVTEALKERNSRTSKTLKQSQTDNPQPVGFGLVHGDYDGDYDSDAPPEHHEHPSATRKAPTKQEGGPVSHTHAPPAQPSRTPYSPKPQHGGPSASSKPPPRHKSYDGVRNQTISEMKRAGSPSVASSRRRKSSITARAVDKPASYHDEATTGASTTTTTTTSSSSGTAGASSGRKQQHLQRQR